MQARPPRALCPRGSVAGHALGRPDDSPLQRWIIMDALALLGGPPARGDVVARHDG